MEGIQGTGDCSESVNGSWLRELLLHRLLPQLSGHLVVCIPTYLAKFYFPFLFNKNPAFDYIYSALSYLCFYQGCPIHLKNAPFLDHKNAIHVYLLLLGYSLLGSINSAMRKLRLTHRESTCIGYVYISHLTAPLGSQPTPNIKCQTNEW